MWERITPPKIVPRAFVSLGRSSTLIAGTRSGIPQYSAGGPGAPARGRDALESHPVSATVPTHPGRPWPTSGPTLFHGLPRWGPVWVIVEGGRGEGPFQTRFSWAT